MIGVAITKAAIKRGIKVLAFSRKNSSKISRIPKSDLVRIVECDLDRIRDFDASAVDQHNAVDCFYHLGWTFTDHANRNDPRKQERNIQYTLDAVDLAKRLGAKKFVGAGSQAEYGQATVPLNASVPCRPEISYGVAKFAAGRLAALACEQNGLDFNWVRILSIFGINDSDATLIKTFIKNCSEDRKMNLGPCTHLWDYLFEDDAGESFIEIGEKGVNGKIYCLGSGTSVPLRDYLERIKAIVNPSYDGAMYGAIPYGSKALQFLQADITDLTADTGWKPKTRFEDGIRMMIDSSPSSQESSRADNISCTHICSYLGGGG